MLSESSGGIAGVSHRADAIIEKREWLRLNVNTLAPECGINRSIEARNTKLHTLHTTVTVQRPEFMVSPLYEKGAFWDQVLIVITMNQI